MQLDAAPVEEHLLVCEECRARLAEWGWYVRAMRVAVRRVGELTKQTDSPQESPAITVTLKK